MICIYTIKSPSGKVYVGQAVDFERRIIRYKNLSCKSQKKLYSSLVKYGFDKHEVNISHQFPYDISLSILNTYEELYIQLYKDAGVELLNLTKGGDGCRGYVYTEEVKEAMRKGALGKKKSNTARLKMSNYHKNRPVAHQTKLGLSRSRKVLQYSLDGEIIKEWPSLFEAANSGNGDVRSCINGRQYTAGGYVWEYVHNKSQDIKEVIAKNIKLSNDREIERREKIGKFQASRYVRKL